ncbi:uncharacterized protein LOC128347973 isoform X2 [Hemicordylus capensis]|uniref:uncharacterized protein LOC128347973 isoform X2 n=1 Tax=Hemicordylus capensis TaxID=884348 RepID=UPI002303AC85|nr:uncharacterized protein LOC128347973 isoform X2 [Hemicordylus capensis]
MPSRKGPGKEKGKGKAPAPKRPQARPREPDPSSGSEDEGQLVMARILSRLEALESRKKATRGEGSKAVGKQGARKAGNQPNKQLQLLQSIEARLDALESGEGEATGAMENASRNALDADVGSFDCQAPPLPLRILIYGHSYVFWASRRARQTSLGTQLGLAGAAQVEWMGRRGMLWDLFLPLLDEYITAKGAPHILVVHLGGNDLGLLQGRALSLQAIKDFQGLAARWPEMQLVWSNLLPRTRWRGQGGPLCFNRARKKVNKAVGRAITALGGTIIQHPDIRVQDATLYRGDGVHLSDQGNEVFLRDLQRGLQEVLAGWGKRG